MANTLLFLFTMLSLFSLMAEEVDTSGSENGQESSSIMPKYGNWCGLNHPANPAKAENPIDTLDAICKQHDLCYLAKGHMNCECDSEFTQAVNLNQHRFKGTEKILARTFRIYFKGSPCYGDQKDKIAPTRVLTSITEKADVRTRQIIHKIETIAE